MFIKSVSASSKFICVIMTTDQLAELLSDATITIRFTPLRGVPSIRFEKAKKEGDSLFRPFVLPK